MDATKPSLAILCCLISVISVVSESPYRFFNWNVTFGNISPLGPPQQGILINGMFPGPDSYAVTNDNLIINVYNSLNEPFLISWQIIRNGVQQRKNSWEDGVYGTNCPIPPGANFTYKLQVKDQIGSFFYFPSLAFHKAAGGFGGIRVLSRPLIPVPFPPPADDFTVLVGDWFMKNHTDLKAILDSGNNLPSANGVLVNGRGPGDSIFTVEPGKTYRLRISNVGLQSTLNFRIQGHKMKLVEVEGIHTIQNVYSSLDVHVGQSMSVLVTADRPPRDYHIAVSTRFLNPILAGSAVLHYSNSRETVSGPLPTGQRYRIDWSLSQARSIRHTISFVSKHRTNLTASGPRPNPQGSYHYGSINVTRTIRIANSKSTVNGKERYAVNGVSFVDTDTPLKLADYFNISGVFRVGSIPDAPPAPSPVRLDTAVMHGDYHAFVEIVFENTEYVVQSWHLDGYNSFVVGMDLGKWSPASRKGYNLVDAISRCTVQVYPQGWTAVYVSLDNVGMWNLRSEIWQRRNLGQQFYLRVYTPSHSYRDELPIPANALLCGRAKPLLL
ncbi:L-ascorbate oxidase [Ananas comosus]|uniref:L-ascorbate oxidase n=1 Tax=Ananas comosus TaxID=4615 RepID=A0A199W4X9_ANACO|nr:L-ascorbate oxidase [Ananas comosus]